MNAKRALTRVRAPDEHGAERRAWAVVHSTYQERLPSPRRRTRSRPALALAVAVLIAAVALSPAGASVGRLITRALGVQHAAQALFSLPSPGRLLVSGSGGTWTVAADGSTRRIGPWLHASWSPRGLYIAVAGEDQLAAVAPRGTPRWTLARPAVSDPRWYPPSGYRVAYLSQGDLRVVAGDGTGDHLLAASVAHVPPAWRPGHAYELAYVSKRGRLQLREADGGRLLWSTPAGAAPKKLAWSVDGQRLLALSPQAVRVDTAGGVEISSLALPPSARAIDGALSPDGHTLALVLGGGSSEVVVENLAARHRHTRRVLAGAGLREVVWSPDGRWLLVSWPAADQWVFVRVAGAPRIAAVSRIAQQFSARLPPGRFPRLDGWCCAAGGSAG